VSTLFCWGRRPRHADAARPVALVVVDSDGVTRPGYGLRAGDFITETHYDHDRRVMTARVAEQPLTLRLRFRRWWESR
jgi:hypothetical protein